MAQLERKTQLIFAGEAAAAANGVSIFGSLAAVDPDYSLDPDDIQSLQAWLDGWASALLTGNAPALEDMNAVLYVLSRQIAYILQQGIPEWDAATTYYAGQLCYHGGQVYEALQETINDEPSDVINPTDWVVREMTNGTLTGVTTGVVTGTLQWSMPNRSTGYKKVAIFLDNLTTDGDVVITFPVAFANIPKVTGDADATGVASVVATTCTINTAVAKGGWIFIEGF